MIRYSGLVLLEVHRHLVARFVPLVVVGSMREDFLQPLLPNRYWNWFRQRHPEILS
jgi:hypothetical protein